MKITGSQDADFLCLSLNSTIDLLCDPEIKKCSHGSQMGVIFRALSSHTQDIFGNI